LSHTETGDILRRDRPTAMTRRVFFLCPVSAMPLFLEKENRMEQHQVMMFTEMLKQMMRSILAKSNVTIHSLSQETACHADLADRASHESDRNMMLIMSQRDRILLDEIRNALERVDLGEYGICFECGEDIGVARLMAQPTATLCVHCKSAIENERMHTMNSPYGASEYLFDK
jgi:DnaK suppressor protein